MRVVVIGVSGSGKTTLAQSIAARLNIPHIELDAINWQAGWHDLNRNDPDEFIRRAGAAVAGDTWVVDGNYSVVRHKIWPRATHLVWLDYERPIIMRRVILRTLRRALLRTELWAGNRERFRVWTPSHPIRWAWTTWPTRRGSITELLAQPEFAHLTVLRLRHPREAASALDRLTACG